MSLSRRILLAIAAGCGLAMAAANGGEGKPNGQDEAAIKEFVSYLAKNGVKLQKDKSGWWAVEDEKADCYRVIVSLKTFPPSATDKEMQAALRQINLAYMLNAPSHLAMSHPGLQIIDPMNQPPKLDQIPVAAKLKKLFTEYRPADPAKKSGR